MVRMVGRVFSGSINFLPNNRITSMDQGRPTPNWFPNSHVWHWRGSRIRWWAMECTHGGGWKATQSIIVVEAGCMLMIVPRQSDGSLRMVELAKFTTLGRFFMIGYCQWHFVFQHRIREMQSALGNLIVIYKTLNSIFKDRNAARKSAKTDGQVIRIVTHLLRIIYFREATKIAFKPIPDRPYHDRRYHIVGVGIPIGGKLQTF